MLSRQEHPENVFPTNEASSSANALVNRHRSKGAYDGDSVFLTLPCLEILLCGT